MADKSQSHPLGDEIQRDATLQAIWHYLHDSGSAAEKAKLVEMTEHYGQKVAKSFKSDEDKPKPSK